MKNRCKSSSPSAVCLHLQKSQMKFLKARINKPKTPFSCYFRKHGAPQMTGEKKNTQLTERIIGFDVLRAIMLFMLFVFHCGVSFMESTIDPEIWLYKNESTHIVFDGVLGFIHTFRHPTFFIISGFVTEMMYRRYASKTVLMKRFQRLFIPFLITVVFIGPVVCGLLAQLYGVANPFSVASMFPATDNYPYSINTSFTWFLYYLVLYNLIHFCYHLVKRKPVDSSRTSSQFVFLISLLVLTVFVGFMLFLWGENSLFGLYSFFPALGSIGGYFLFYVMGILLYRHAGDLEKIKSLAWPFVGLGFVALTIYFMMGKYKLEQGISTLDFDWGLMITSTFASILFSYGGLGLAMKYYTKPRRAVSYISRSSYFLYLIHFPFVLILLHFFAHKPWGAIPKFLVVLSLTTFITLAVNHLWIKAWKNKPPI